MDRRKFLLGVGGASIGGSALVGSGAFSRVEAQRAVTIQVAEDPDAYLGLDKCRYPDYEGEHVPNGSYAHLDGHGHLAILMNDENPHYPDDDLGAGVNSNSRTWFDRVFQVCNQGKQTVCVWIDDKEGDYAERVSFYLGDDADDSLESAENGVALDVGDCICVGLQTDTRDAEEFDTDMPSASDQLLEEVTIYAVAGEECPGAEEPRFPPEEVDDPDDVPADHAISWVSFCVSDGAMFSDDIKEIKVTGIKDDDPFQPTRIEWESAVDVDTVTLKGGQQYWQFTPGGADSGTATMGTGADDGALGGQSPNSPCGDGTCGVKFNWEDEDGFVSDGHQDECDD